jgi:YVTN family beta-propeller protein
MRHASCWPLALVLATDTLITPAAPAPSKANTRPVYKSPLGIIVDATGKRAYVALHTAGAVAVVDLRAGKVLREIPVGKKPYDIALAGGTLFVTCEGDDTLVLVDLGRGAVQRRVRFAQGPRGLAIEPDGSRAYVACHDAQALQWRETKTGRLRSLSLPGFPGRLALVPSRQALYLPCTQGGKANLVVVSTRSTPKVETVKLLVGASNPRGLAFQPNPNFKESSGGLIVHQRPKASIPTTQVAQGWVFTNAVSFLNHDRGERMDPALAGVLDEPHRGFSDPTDVAIVGKPDQLFVACGGADVVLAVDFEQWARSVVKRYQKAAEKKEAEAREDTNSDDDFDVTDSDYGALADDLTTSRRFVSARIPTQANPRRLAISGDSKTLVVSNYLADSLTVIDVPTKKVVRHIPLSSPKPDAARRGEILFNSGRMTFHGQFTCASCHPGGGSDGLSWDLTRDGIGNFKKTKPLLGVRDTAPYGWHGSSPTLADRVAGTLRTLHRHEPAGTEVADLVAYLRTLPPPRPLPQKEADRPAAIRGRAIFRGKGQCAACHRRAALDDGKLHDVGTRGPTDTQSRFDTPALLGVARTAPYLHDGRARTLEEVFTKHNKQQRHGAAHQLTKQELADLMAYLKGL